MHWHIANIDERRHVHDSRSSRCFYQGNNSHIIRVQCVTSLESYVQSVKAEEAARRQGLMTRHVTMNPRAVIEYVELYVRAKHILKEGLKARVL